MRKAEGEAIERFVENASAGVSEGYIASWSVSQTSDGYAVVIVLADREICAASPDLMRALERASSKMAEAAAEPEAGAVLQ